MSPISPIRQQPGHSAYPAYLAHPAHQAYLAYLAYLSHRLISLIALITPPLTSKKMNTEITIREAQRLVDQWINQYGVRYFSELTNMACLTEEVGELARIIARKYGDQSFKAGEPTDPADEMADVMWVLLCLANQTGVDLTEALKKNIEKKTLRDSKRHLENKKLSSNK